MDNVRANAKVENKLAEENPVGGMGGQGGSGGQLPPNHPNVDGQSTTDQKSGGQDTNKK